MFRSNSEIDRCLANHLFEVLIHLPNCNSKQTGFRQFICGVQPTKIGGQKSLRIFLLAFARAFGIPVSGFFNNWTGPTANVRRSERKIIIFIKKLPVSIRSYIRS